MNAIQDAQPQIEMISFQETDIWCRCHPLNQDFGLCGSELEVPYVPDDEIPDENTCPECLAIIRRLAIKP